MSDTSLEQVPVNEKVAVVEGEHPKEPVKVDGEEAQKKVLMFLCTVCNQQLEKVLFSKHNRDKHMNGRKCKVCAEEARKSEEAQQKTNGGAAAEVPQKEEPKPVQYHCVTCNKDLDKDMFSSNQLRKKGADSRNCKNCLAYSNSEGVPQKQLISDPANAPVDRESPMSVFLNRYEDLIKENDRLKRSSAVAAGAVASSADAKLLKELKDIRKMMAKLSERVDAIDKILSRGSSGGGEVSDVSTSDNTNVTA